jgi:hypothetical protein
MMEGGRPRPSGPIMRRAEDGCPGPKDCVGADAFVRPGCACGNGRGCPRGRCRGGRLVRPGRAQLGSALRPLKSPSRLGKASTAQDAIGKGTTSAVPTRPSNPCHSEPLAGALSRRGRARNLLFSSYTSDRNSEMRNTTDPFQASRGGITIARHVSAGVSLGSRPRALRTPLCECLCRGGRLVRPGRAQLGSTLRPLKSPSRLGKGSTAQDTNGKGTTFSRAAKTFYPLSS